MRYRTRTKIFKLRYSLAIGNLFTNLRFHWHTMERSTIILISAAFIIIFSAISILYKAAMEKIESREIHCLALNIYHEARGEPLSGRYAVAEVTMNRVKSPLYPNDVCRVVYQRVWDTKRKKLIGAFSWTAERAKPNINRTSWLDSVAIAKQIYYGETKTPAHLKDALYYHADYVKPNWASDKVKLTKIGRHIFYK